jgi:hypothetical protein
VKALPYAPLRRTGGLNSNVTQGVNTVASGAVLFDTNILMGANFAASYGLYVGNATSSDPVVELRAQVVQLQGRVDALEEALGRRVRPIQLSTLGAEGMRLRLPLAAELETQDGVVVASIADFGFYADAEDEVSAVVRLQEEIAQEFAYLSAHEAELGPGPLATLVRLREIIEVSA